MSWLLAEAEAERDAVSGTDEMNVFSRIQVAERYFSGTTYHDQLWAAISRYHAGDLVGAVAALDKLPTKLDLLGDLVEHVKGKPAYKTLSKIAAGYSESAVERVKGLSSLMTHACIAIEKGGREYLMLVEDLHLRIAEALFSIKMADRDGADGGDSVQ